MLLITHPCDPIGLECQDWSEDVIGMRRGSKHFPALSLSLSVFACCIVTSFAGLRNVENERF